MAEYEGFEIHPIQTAEEFDRMGPEWRQLEQATGHVNISASYDWLRTWWSVFEYKRSWQFGVRKELRILRLSRAGELVAIAPLVRVERRRFFRKVTSIEFLGQQWGATMIDFISRVPSREVARAVLNWLERNERYDLVSLSYVPETTPYFDVGDCSLTLLSACPIIYRSDFPDYETYRGAFYSGGFRAEVRKLFARLKARGQELDFGAVRADGAALEEVRRLSLSKLEDKKGSPFLDRDKERFLAEIHRVLPMEVQFLQVNGRRVAYVIIFVFGGGWFAFDTSYDRAYRDASPGKLLLMEIMRRFWDTPAVGFFCAGTGLGYHKRRHFARLVRLYTFTQPGNTRRAPACGARALAEARAVAQRFEAELAAWGEPA